MTGLSDFVWGNYSLERNFVKEAEMNPRCLDVGEDEGDVQSERI